MINKTNQIPGAAFKPMRLSSADLYGRQKLLLQRTELEIHRMGSTSDEIYRIPFDYIESVVVDYVPNHGLLVSFTITFIVVGFVLILAGLDDGWIPAVILGVVVFSIFSLFLATTNRYKLAITRLGEKDTINICTTRSQLEKLMETMHRRIMEVQDVIREEQRLQGPGTTVGINAESGIVEAEILEEDETDTTKPTAD